MRSAERNSKGWRGGLVGAVLAAILFFGAAPSPALVEPPPMVNAIVQQWDGADTSVASSVQSLGGTVTRQLPSVLGFAARLPASAVEAVAALPGVRVISPDTVVLPQDTPADGGPADVHREATGAAAAHAAGFTGAGVTVAVVDTGISPVGPLASRLVSVDGAACVNLSTEPGCNDSYGHGTFIAGLVNATAPDAGLLAIKLSGRDGVSNASQVIAAIDWVLTNGHRFGVKVINLSLRTDSNLSYRLDPVNFAVERAWAAGITVVVSAGNQGSAAGTIAKPADDPWVISVGSTDDKGTASLADDTVATFSSRGPTAQGIVKPDIAVPGKSLVSLRSPGSEADLRYPHFVGATHRRGSGTSFSAGIVSGAAAVLHQADPSATNDRVKFAMRAAAAPVAGTDANAVGAGHLRLDAARSAPAGEANGELFHPVLFTGGVGTAADWQGSNWQGSNWQGSNWQGSNWQGSNWQGSNWQGSNWQGSNWQGSNWQGSNWQGSNWQGSNWQGSNWQGSNWQSQYWS